MVYQALDLDNIRREAAESAETWNRWRSYRSMGPVEPLLSHPKNVCSLTVTDSTVRNHASYGRSEWTVNVGVEDRGRTIMTEDESLHLTALRISNQYKDCHRMSA